MATSSVASMQIEHNSHARWTAPPRSLRRIRPRILLSAPPMERSKSNPPSSGAVGRQENTVEPCASQMESPMSERVKKHQKILERWASKPESPASERARQHREILERSASERAMQRPKIIERWARMSSAPTTDKRRAHEDELSALSAKTEPVMARAASLLHEIEASPTHAVGEGKAGDCDLPVKTRASSLIQMWRVIEAEGAVGPTLHGGGGHATATAFSPLEVRSESLEDDSGWDSDLTGASLESEKEQGSTVRTTVGTEQAGMKRRGWSGGSRHWLRGRQQIQKLFDKFGDERRRELRILAEQRHVSGFMYRNRIQTFLKYRTLLRQRPDQNLRPQSTAQELDQLQHGIAILFLRQRFNPRPHQSSTTSPTVATKSACHMSLSSNSKISKPCDLSVIYHKEDVERELDDVKSEKYSSVSESEDLQEGSQHSDVAWEEASSQNSNSDWQSPTICLNSHNEQDEVIVGESNNDHDQQIVEADGMRLSSLSSQSVLESHRGEEMCNDLVETYSDNTEIRELLERRTVSASLASDFRDKLNEVLLSSLERQRVGDDMYVDEDEEQLDQGYTHDFGEDHNVASSSLIMPSSSSTFVHQRKRECSSFNNPVVKMDVVLSMRSDIANIHHEMGEIRKLLESYMHRNPFQCSVQQDVTTVVRRSVSMGSTYSSEWEPTRKGSCCICNEKQIDSLLYRCGHMCTCFKCAHELQCDGGRCPVCNAPILDVVRAYTQVPIPS